MLGFLRNGSCALAGAALLFGTAAQAEMHRILIMDEAYFPSVIYVQPGDSLMFENTSEATHTIVGENDSWTSGPIAVDGTYVQQIDSDMPLKFTRKSEGDESAAGEGAEGEEGEGQIFAGEMSYDEPPLSN